MSCLRFRLGPRLARVLCAAACLLAAAPGIASTVVSCPFNGFSGDALTRGIVVPSYAGTNIRRVKLGFFASVSGLYHATLQIRRGSFDGPIVGSSTIYVNVGTSTLTEANFDFGGAPVTQADTLAIIQTSTGPGNLFFDNGNGSCGQAYETTGTSPPLDTLRNNGVGILIEQDDLTGACIPSDKILCVDDISGDRRFKVNIDFSHTGGTSGSGQAIPLSSLGVTQGGAFWFFSQNNPEMLVKVLNACGVNNKYWVFATAGTNVAFTLNIADTVGGTTKTYTNTDNTAALPIQDTAAFPCSTAVPITAYAGNWSGQWVNTTFSTTGPASMVVTVDTSAHTFQTVVTLGGNVLGGSAPPPQTLGGPYNASGVTINTNGTAFGNISATISSSGAIVGSGTSVPNPNISRLDFTGTATPTLITVNYTITFSAAAGGGTAVGVMTFNHN